MNRYISMHRYTLALAVIALCLSAHNVAIALPITNLFNTGVDDNANILVQGSVDPHWQRIASPAGAPAGTDAIVLNDTGFPIPPWLANGPNSKWIAPKANQSGGDPPGNYTYRTTFDLTGLEPATAVVNGLWTSDNQGPSILLNGVPTGFTGDGNFGGLGNAFAINSGFVNGVNTLDFVVNNAGAGNNPTGFRVELSGTANPTVPPGTPPTILAQPTGSTLGSGGAFSLNVSVLGSQPLLYQWQLDGLIVIGATNAIYSVTNASANDSGNYHVIVSNGFGVATSDVALVRVKLRMTPSSRRTGLIFSEIMYHPTNRADGLNAEFVEIHNSNPWPEDIGAWRISGQLDYTFPSNTILGPYDYLVIAPQPADVQTAYGISGVLGGTSNLLSNNSGTLRLRKKSGAVVLDLTYADDAPWPVAADGAGHSLVLGSPSFGEANPRAWAASGFKGGSPGQGETPSPSPFRNVVINEVLTHTDVPMVDAIELYNRGTNPVDISGCFLSDDPGTNKFPIPGGTILNGGSFVSFDQTQLGFALSAQGETVYFVNPLNTHVIEAIKIGGQANGISMGRSPDGAPSFSPLSTPTLGTNNAIPLLYDLVINEIMYNPISGDGDDEYIELYNRGSGSVNLEGWRLSDGIDFTFPNGTVMPAGGYLVVARDALRLMSNYPGLGPTNLLGNYTGRLANDGERIALGMPDTLLETNGPTIITSQFYIVVDEITYQDGGSWGRWADGGGSSLELIDSRSDNRQASNWADSDESDKSAWVTVEQIDVMNLNHPAIASIDQLHFFLLGAGEALVDDVDFTYSGINRVGNPDFETGLGGWFFQGTQRPSFLETTEGFGGSQSLHLVATARGGVANRVRTQLTIPIPADSLTRVRAKVRWLRGHPEIVFRAVGSSIEAAGALPVPKNLGTPGAVNSRSATNVGPAIFDVGHRPVLPKAGEPIQVTARIQDPDGLTNVFLRYRVDPSAILSTIIMTRMNDGRFRGEIPGQAADTLIAFHVEALDRFAPQATGLFPDDAPVRECLVRVGETLPAGDFGTYRLWMTQATFDFWANRENSSNEDVDTTFVYGTNRVVYNVGSHYGASDNYTTILNTPIGTPVGYNLEFPQDESFLGTTKVRLDWPIRDPTLQREHLMHWFLEQYELPNNYRRYIHFFINGVRRKGNNGNLYEDTQRPSGDMLKEWFANDPDGELFKTDPWFEANAAGVFNAGVLLRPFLQSFTNVMGEKKQAYYRFNWKPRSIDRSANDYTNLFCLIDAANIAGPTYVSALGGIVDMENWMKTFAMNDLASFWDSFGNPNSKNAYVYKPERSGWKIMSWDFDVGLGVFNDPPTAPLFGAGVDPAIVRMYNTPAFVRHYWRALDEAVYGFFNAASVTPFLSDRFAVFENNNNGAVSPFVPSGAFGLSVTDWITQRRTFILGELAAVDDVFSVNGPTNIVATQNLITVTGTAPLRAGTVVANGMPYPVTWTTETAWSMRIPIGTGTNLLTMAGLDGEGGALPGASRTLTATFAGQVPPPDGLVVINEIMYNPTTRESEYIEIFNNSDQFAFDLSNWVLDGISYTFPPGSIITNGQYLLLVKQRLGFAKVHGFQLPVYDAFNGSLDNDGETLMLLRPSRMSPVDQVTYDVQAPWPITTGTALELIDSNGDNSRAANWIGSSNTPGAVNSATGIQPPVPSLWLTEVQPDNQTGITDNMGEREPWIELHNSGTNALSLDGFYLASSFTNLFEWAFPSGAVIQAGEHLVIWADGEPGESTGTQWHTGFRLNPSTGSVTLSQTVLLDYLNYDSVPPNQSYGAYPPGQICFRQVFAIPTPGGTNNPAFPPVSIFINEWMASNQGAFPDAAGLPVIEFDDWFELYNPSTNPVNLAGYYLTDDAADPTKFTIPAGIQIPAQGFLLVWADEQSGQTATNGDLHVNFKLSGSGEGIHLYAPDLQLVDGVTFGAQTANISQGRFPNGGPAPFVFMPTFTPRASNVIEILPIVITDISETMPDTVVVTWNSQVGLIYRVQFTDDLFNPGWTDLPGDVTAVGPATMKMDTYSGPRRYYRVVTGF